MTTAARFASQPLRHDPLAQGEVRIGAVAAALRAVKTAERTLVEAPARVVDRAA